MSLKKDCILKSIQAAYRESTAGSWNSTDRFKLLWMHVHTTPAKKNAIRIMGPDQILFNHMLQIVSSHI